MSSYQNLTKKEKEYVKILELSVPVAILFELKGIPPKKEIVKKELYKLAKNLALNKPL